MDGAIGSGRMKKALEMFLIGLGVQYIRSYQYH